MGEHAATNDTGKMILFIQSILRDLNIPQDATTVLYEDNDACTDLPHGRTILIKTFTLCEWIEQDLILMEHIDTTINIWPNSLCFTGIQTFSWDMSHPYTCRLIAITLELMKTYIRITTMLFQTPELLPLPGSMHRSLTTTSAIHGTSF